MKIRLALLFVLLPFPAAALEVGGHFKSLNLHLQAPPRSGELSSNALRLDLTGEAWEFSAEDVLRYSDPPGLVPLPRDSANRALDLEKSWNGEGRFSNRLAVDRLNLHGTLGGVEWTVGRQSIGFGRMLLFSPLDVIAPFAPDALDTDVRPGVDALRLVRYYGLGGQLGAAAVFGGSGGHDSYLATASHHVGEVDLLALGGRLRGRAMAGLGMAGQLGGTGIKGEAAFYRGRDVGEARGDLHDDFAIAGVELEHRFAGDLMVAGQYLYNGAGVDGAEDYPMAASSAPFAEGLAFLLGRHYLLLTPSWEAHPLATLGALLIWNLEDDSCLFRPLLDLSLSDDLALQLFWSFTAGEEPETVLGLPVVRSEFGSAGDSGGLFLKYYF